MTPNGAALAARLAAALPGVEVFVRADAGAAGAGRRAVRVPGAGGGRSASTATAATCFVMATGIVVRPVAGLWSTRPRTRRSSWSTNGAALRSACCRATSGGANTLARQVAAVLGAQPVITTATDVNEVPAIDVLALEAGLAIENPQAIKTVNMALLTGAAVEVHDPFGLLSNRIPNARAVGPGRAPSCAGPRLRGRPHPGRPARRPDPEAALAGRRHRLQPQHRGGGNPRAAARDPAGSRPVPGEPEGPGVDRSEGG